MTLPTSIRTQVSEDALSKVTRLFNGTVVDVLNELLQNARRGGATRVEIETAKMADGQKLLLVRDDGRGIADPTVLLTLGQSGWSEQTDPSEDPAGMGMFSLAGKRVRIRSFSQTNGSWRVVVPAAAWESRASIAVEPCTIDRGTEIAIDMPEGWDKQVEAAARNAARHYPLPVTLDGAPLEQADFLANAVHVEDWNGCRIGVFESPATSDREYFTINFHGLIIHCSMPYAAEVDIGRSWSTRVDIVDAPDLHLVLPARKELVDNEARHALDTACRKAIYRAIGLAPEHRLPFEHWAEARLLEVELPEAAPWLRVWAPAMADHHQPRRDRGTVTGEPMIIVPYDEPDIEQSAAPALMDVAMLGGHAVREQSRFGGYAWYDALPRVDALRFRFNRGGVAVCADATAVEPHAEEGLVSDLRVEAVIISPGLTSETETLRTGSIQMLVRSTDCYGIEEALIYVDEAAPVGPSELAELIENCLFSPCDDRDCDSWDTQLANFRREARFHAMDFLHGEDAAREERLAAALRSEIAWLVPKGMTLTACITGFDVTLDLAYPVDPASPIAAPPPG